MRFGGLKPLNPITPEVKQAVRVAIATNAESESIALPDKLPPDTIEAEAQEAVARLTEFDKLSKLVDDDFPFDESQLDAINGMVSQRYACLTGAAGTGKTTTTKKLVDTLLSSSALGAVNMSEYFIRGKPEDDGYDSEEEQEVDWVPSVCLCGFTGRSAQMIKKNFPTDWHPNIMTIHRMLAFVPEFYEDVDAEDYVPGKKKMRFVPTYTADCQLPWDIIVIDEAGMVGLELWHQVWAAAKPGCRIYMIGDINQLPPVHGRSVFGFAMAKWPSWELTHVHRQQGKNNPIVDNAWRVLNGQVPKSEGKFQMLEIQGDAQLMSRKIRAIIPKLQEKGVYDPIRDTIITPINGEDGQKGYSLGQLPLNREFSLIFNPRSANPRYIIDGGRERKQLAVGDKVMATRNDHEAGITNGMTGIITDIQRNAAYGGDHRRFGTIEEVNEYMQSEEVEEHDEFTLDDLQDSFTAIDQGIKDKKEKADRGPASHIVTVRFGDEDHGFEMAFATLAEVGTLMTAYVVTCHKMQGGESPVIIIILHDAHKAMLYREWLYTAITRASRECYIFYTKDAIRVACAKQSIKGKTLKEKVEAFNRLQDTSGILGAAVHVKLPESEDIANVDQDKSKALVLSSPQAKTYDSPREEPMVPALAEQPADLGQTDVAKVDPPRKKLFHERIKDLPPSPKQPEIHIHIHTGNNPVGHADVHESVAEIIDGGDLRPVRDKTYSLLHYQTGLRTLGEALRPPVHEVLARLPAPAPLVSQWGAYYRLKEIEEQRDLKLLEYKPEKPKNLWAQKLAKFGAK